MAKRAGPEEVLQRAVARYLDAALPAGSVHFHVPNGGGRTKAEGGALKAQGVKRGVPDHCIVYAGQPIFLELKTAHGRLSNDQRTMAADLAMAGARVSVVRSLDDVEAELRTAGVPIQATTGGAS